MDFLKKLFPMSFKKSAEVKDLVKRIVIYALLSTAVAILYLLVSLLESDALSFVMSQVFALSEAYCTGGIVLAILVHCNVIKLNDGNENNSES